MTSADRKNYRKKFNIALDLIEAKMPH
jgi:hypothetical protein